MIKQVEVTEEVRDHTENVVMALDVILNGTEGESTIAFVLVTVPWEGGVATFATNGLDRQTAVRLMKNMAAQLDGEVH